MDSKIRLLSDHTINQIAAGEVIENPASVVKELVENAIDAGAEHVCVETLGGGYHLIRISDNGSGMSPDDALLSLQRHATSKIGAAEDLLDLLTMGFRGEAMASIASVSKMTLLTSIDGTCTTRIEIEGGKILQVEPSARAKGTTIEVRSLFYNVPARKKFQKSAAISTAEMTKVMTNLSLAHLDVGFELIHNEREVFLTRSEKEISIPQAIARRSHLLLGSDYSSASLEIEVKEGVCDLKGLVGAPLSHRHNRSGQHLFVNRRHVNCPAISYAIRDAYGTRLPSDRHPTYVLHLELPPQLIDVNVHPQKKEIRLREEKRLKENIRSAVNLSLQRAEGTTSAVVLDHPPSFQSFPEFNFNQARSFTNHDFSEQPSSIAFRENTFPSLSFREEAPIIEKELFSHSEVQSIGLFKSYWMIEAEGLKEAACLKKTQESPGVVLVDLLAAKSRIIFDRLVEDPDPIVSQGLLIPLTMQLSLSEFTLLEAHPNDFKKLGIEIHLIGRNSCLIDSLPAFIPMAEAEKVIRDLFATLEQIQDEAGDDQARLRHLATTTCRFVHADKKTFMLQEAQELFKKLLISSSPYFCPNGRPTMIHMSKDEIEEKFSK